MTAPAAGVRWVGAQRDVLGGDIGGKISLRSLAALPNLYALGPRAGVSGEITVFDGEPCVARVVDGAGRVESSVDHEACSSSTSRSRPGAKPGNHGRSTTKPRSRRQY